MGVARATGDPETPATGTARYAVLTLRAKASSRDDPPFPGAFSCR